jgi:hypothetical protein
MTDDDARLLEFAERGRMTSFPDDRSVLRVGDMETLFAILERDGRFELESSDRSSTPRVLMSSESLDLVRRYLLLVIGETVRAQLRLPPLPTSSAADASPAGFTLDDDGAGITLRWSDAAGDRSAWFRRGIAGAQNAVQFARVVGASEADLIEAMLEPGASALLSGSAVD